MPPLQISSQKSAHAFDREQLSECFKYLLCYHGTLSKFLLMVSSCCLGARNKPLGWDRFGTDRDGNQKGRKQEMKSPSNARDAGTRNRMLRKSEVALARFAQGVAQ